MRLLPRAHTSEDLLIALLDNELTDLEREPVERHLMSCASCVEVRSRHERARSALRAYLAAETLKETVAVPQEAPTPLMHYRLRPGVGAAGAGVLAGVAGAVLVAGLLSRRSGRRVVAA